MASSQSILRHFWFLAAMATLATCCVAVIPIILTVGICLWPFALAISRFTKPADCLAAASDDKASLDDTHLDQVPCITGPALSPAFVNFHDNALFELTEDPDCCSVDSLSTSSTTTVDLASLGYGLYYNGVYESDDVDITSIDTTSTPVKSCTLLLSLASATPLSPSQRPSMNAYSSQPAILILPSPPMAPTTPPATPTGRPVATTPTTSSPVAPTASPLTPAPSAIVSGRRTCKATPATPSYMRPTASSKARRDRVMPAAIKTRTAL